MSNYPLSLEEWAESENKSVYDLIGEVTGRMAMLTDLSIKDAEMETETNKAIFLVKGENKIFTITVSKEFIM